MKARGQEERGIAVEVTDLIDVYSDPEHVIEFSGGELRTSDESKEVLWVAPDDLGELKIHPTIRLRIVTV